MCMHRCSETGAVSLNSRVEKESMAHQPKARFPRMLGALVEPDLHAAPPDLLAQANGERNFTPISGLFSVLRSVLHGKWRWRHAKVNSENRSPMANTVERRAGGRRHACGSTPAMAGQGASLGPAGPWSHPL